MLKKITLTNFRQHLDRTFEFGPGLNAVRGENEAGKTTVLEAFTYFCFGANALRESLDDVVTYHQPVSKLRVDCELEHLGVTYRGYRGKSGAEVNFGNEKVTGQREVTRFFENLFGTSADMAGKLMFASQKSLAESLKAGPTAAGKMIEDLANFDLIDRVAEAIAARRQTGNTSGVEGRIEALQGQVNDAPAEDLTPLRGQIMEAAAAVTDSEEKLASLRNERAALDVEGALRTVHQHEQRARDIATLTFEIDQIDRALARPAVVGPNDIELAAARRAVEDEKHAARAAQLHAELKQADTSELWDESLEKLEAEITTQTSKVWDLHAREDAATVEILRLEREKTAAVHATNLKIAQLEGRLIKETTCALCQKDLTDVPEVVRANSDLQRQITEAEQQGRTAYEELDALLTTQTKVRDTLRAEWAEANQYLKDLQHVVAVNNRVEQMYARAAEFITVDRSGVPGTWRWAGPLPEAVGGESAANRLALLERRQHEAMQDAATRSAATKRRADLVEARAKDIQLRDELDVEGAKARGLAAEHLDSTIRDVAAQLISHQAVLQRLQADLATREALAAQAARQLEQMKTQLAAAQAELAQMQKYNALIRKVRAARPAITNKLWNIVLGGVSKHLTEIRDQPSMITRADGVFKCNGYPASGLSGSAEDMLGLAMRITLTKTFLPGIDMLQLDEPGAACSDARETRMLGVLSTLNFGQIVMISHNPLVDAVADRIINV